MLTAIERDMVLVGAYLAMHPGERVTGGTLLRLPGISKHQPLLSKTLQPLIEGGLVQNTRGRHGGYQLRLEPPVTVGEVLTHCGDLLARLERCCLHPKSILTLCCPLFAVQQELLSLLRSMPLTAMYTIPMPMEAMANVAAWQPPVKRGKGRPPKE